MMKWLFDYVITRKERLRLLNVTLLRILDFRLQVILVHGIHIEMGIGILGFEVSIGVGQWIYRNENI